MLVVRHWLYRITHIAQIPAGIGTCWHSLLFLLPCSDFSDLDEELELGDWKPKTAGCKQSLLWSLSMLKMKNNIEAPRPEGEHWRYLIPQLLLDGRNMYRALLSAFAYGSNSAHDGWLLEGMLPLSGFERELKLLPWSEEGRKFRWKHSGALHCSNLRICLIWSRYTR